VNWSSGSLVFLLAGIARVWALWCALQRAFVKRVYSINKQAKHSYCWSQMKLLVKIPAATEEPLLPAVAPPPLPFLMRKMDPTTVYIVRRTPSLQADVLCKLVGEGIYEFERVEGEWALVSPSEYERLKATGEAFVAHDASAEGWCRVTNSKDASVLWSSLNVDDTGAAVAVHRSLLALCASFSWATAPLLPSLQTMFDDESPSVQAYACSAAGSWCLAAIVAAVADALPILRYVIRLCGSSVFYKKC
jgi:hypothetical protein